MVEESQFWAFCETSFGQFYANFDKILHFCILTRSYDDILDTLYACNVGKKVDHVGKKVAEQLKRILLNYVLGLVGNQREVNPI